MVPLAIVTTPTALSLKYAWENNYGFWDGLFLFSREMLKYTTGVAVGRDGSVHWDWKNAMVAGVPLAALVIDAKFIGARRYINQQLGNANVPIVRF